MIGFEKHFSCHSHLGSIWISLLVPFPPETFLQNDKESGTLELYYLSAYCLLLAKNPTSTIGRSPGYSNKSCFLCFSHVITSVPI